MDYTAIIVSIISGIVTILTVIFQNHATQNVISTKLQIHQAVTDEKIENLTREVRQHNEFAVRIPVIEERIKNMESKRA